MFTGIIEETGAVEFIRKTDFGIRLGIRAKLCAEGIRSGGSLAVNGCCLTVVQRRKARTHTLIEFDLLEETWTRTNLQFVREGSAVNLERALAASGRLDGHFVTGHIDGIGRIRTWKPSGADWHLEVTADPEIMRYVVFKGAIAVDGISLTVAAVKRNSFQIWIIPHTREVTALRERCEGDAVNLEADILGKYVEKFAAPHLANAARGTRQGNKADMSR